MGKIVWLASYPKSGNTWVRAFLHNYIKRAQTPHDINRLADFCAPECGAVLFGPDAAALSTEDVQKKRPAVHERLTRLHDDLVFVKTHNANLAVHGVPLVTQAHTAGAVYILRDPRDVAVSYSAFMGLSLDETIALMGHAGAANRTNEVQVFELLSSWSAHVESWTQAKTHFVVRYEDLLEKPEAALGRLIWQLGGEPEPERLKRAIAFSSFDELAGQEAAAGYVASGARGEKFFREGRAGQWRERLSAAQAAAIEAAHGAVMRRFGYL